MFLTISIQIDCKVRLQRRTSYYNRILHFCFPHQKHELGQSAGEDSNSSDTEPSDRGDGQHDGTLDSLDNQRSHSFPNAFLGLQGIPGLLPGPSGMGGNDFGESNCLSWYIFSSALRALNSFTFCYRIQHYYRVFASCVWFIDWLSRLSRTRFAYNLHLLEARCLASYILTIDSNSINR